MTQTGGSVTVLGGGSTRIASSAGSVASYSISAGTLTINQTDFRLAAGGTGSLNISGTGVVTVGATTATGNNLIIAENATGVAVLNLGNGAPAVLWLLAS